MHSKIQLSVHGCAGIRRVQKQHRSTNWTELELYDANGDTLLTVSAFPTGTIPSDEHIPLVDGTEET